MRYSKTVFEKLLMLVLKKQYVSVENAPDQVWITDQKNYTCVYNLLVQVEITWTDRQTDKKLYMCVKPLSTGRDYLVTMLVGQKKNDTITLFHLDSKNKL